ncbi:hypothetical protein KMW28_11175 [Flammeovirga yaeyamensis]|uniref:Uncharacterized protein n=1 Tax=Flammeovirga yaeyamensis TaxID=367791 RepID=A0AAX1N2Y5_9BACT|nr:hypothetical protein [Flammeovirga yaeyamensis]MBB3696281.1 hypothetical protein [Flammeovirga yaeyamensis]NMF34962.1 hypothetical protein [Flammeovirga yaeyamensis]QWG00213.1 hypothetical protein KMW28_11175 [Flammeovirga yaeyamensis]
MDKLSTTIHQLRQKSVMILGRETFFHFTFCFWITFLFSGNKYFVIGAITTSLLIEMIDLGRDKSSNRIKCQNFFRYMTADVLGILAAVAIT